MSDKRVCVCGRGRKNEPVIITITTCRHKHPPKKEDSFTISPPLATSSPTDVSTSTVEKSRQERHTDEQQNSENYKNKSTKDESQEQADNTLYYSAKDQTESAYETANESAVTENTNAIDSNVNESNYNTAENELTEISDFTGNNTAGTGYIADDSLRFAETTSEQSDLTEGFDTETYYTTNQKDETTKDPTLMFLTETSINTMPFLDNLFWTKSATSKSMPNLSEACGDDQENCLMEVFIFEKHSKLCRHYLGGTKKQNSFFDGGALFETLGRASFPVRCEDFNVNNSKSEKLAKIYSQLRQNFKTNLDSKTNFYENTFRTLDKFVKSKQFMENLSNRNSEPLNVKMQKYITMGDDIYQRNFETSKPNVDELYFRKKTNDQSVQFESSNNSRSKWYNIFLICLGLKDTEEVHEADSVDEQPRKESSMLITKYLRI